MSDKVQDIIAQVVWQEYAVEVGRSLPEGLAAKMAAAAVAALKTEGIVPIEKRLLLAWQLKGDTDDANG